MGFFLRKSVRVGPFRLNLSKSGLGVSAGIPGLRFGTGPSGNYIHAGRGGIYYRKSFGKGKDRSSRNRTPEPTLPTLRAGLAQTEAIDSGNVLEVTDSSAGDLLAELNSKHRRPRYWRWVLLAWLVTLFVLFPIFKMPAEYAAIIFYLGFIGIPVVGIMDRRAKQTALLYDLDAGLENEFRKLCDGFDIVTQCNKVWHIQTQSNVEDKKYHAGASSAVERSETKLRYKSPPYVKTNVSIPALPAGKEVIYFFPDRVLVIAKNGVGAVAYRDLKVDENEERFVETGGTPNDAKVVDNTWQYVNAKGGPDRRFKDNPEYPIALYGVLELTSDSGLRERFMVSKTECTREMVKALKEMSQYWAK